MSTSSITETPQLEPKKTAIEELNRALCYTGQLMGLLKCMPPQAGYAQETVDKLLTDILLSITCALAVLEPCSGASSTEAGGQSLDGSHGVDNRAEMEFKEGSSLYYWQGMEKKVKTSKVRERSHKVRKGRTSHRPVSGFLKTDRPHQDGYQWRKYGQKKIQGYDLPREYFRCTYKDDQRCQATKQVQKVLDGLRPLFEVTCYEKHTCKPESDPLEKASNDNVLDSCSGHGWVMNFSSNSIHGSGMLSQEESEEQVTEALLQKSLEGEEEPKQFLGDVDWVPPASPTWTDFERLWHY